MPSSTQLHPTLQNMLCKHPKVNFGTIKVYVSAHLVAWQVIFSPKKTKWVFLGPKMHFLARESVFYKNGQKPFQMVPNGPKWSKMVKNGQNGQKL